MLLKPTEVARMLGVSDSTIRRWVANGIIRSITTAGGHHRFYIDDINNLIERKVSHNNRCVFNTQKRQETINVATYARVCAHKYVNDLRRQQRLLINFCKSNKYNIVLNCAEIATSFSRNRTELFKIIEAACSGRISKIIVEHRDKICGVGSFIVEKFLNNVGCAIEPIRRIRDSNDYENLSADAMFIIANIGAQRFVG